VASGITFSQSCIFCKDLTGVVSVGVTEQSSLHQYNESNSKAIKCRPSAAAEFSLGSAVTIAGTSQRSSFTAPATWSDSTAS